MANEWLILGGVIIGSGSTIIVNWINNKASERRDVLRSKKELYKDEYEANKNLILKYLVATTTLRKEIFTSHESSERGIPYDYEKLNNHIVELSTIVDELDIVLSDNDVSSLARQNYSVLVTSVDDFSKELIKKEVKLNSRLKLSARDFLNNLNELKSKHS